jgi:predicted ATPase/DNA-binding NarL/FixJ family response regulator
MDACASQRVEQPRLRSGEAMPHNLPTQLTSFIGRDAELDEVVRLLATTRLMTIAGAGGCGKTRLALRAARDLVDRWPDGVWWVDLGSVSDPSLVPGLTAAAARALIDPSADPLQTLAMQLRDQQLLLCLDTCEHVLDASAGMVDALLRSCPGLSVLATSREPLRVPGELVWRVPSLVDEDAVRLFSERAALVRPDFCADVDEHSVERICQRLDGIPLAVELAAAWVRVLTPKQIAAGLDDRFVLLSGGPRGVSARHQTLRASLRWSHHLLDEADRMVFRRLAVFAGGFTLDAARAVCGVTDDPEHDRLLVLGRLVDKSLVVVDEEPVEARYRLLDTVRQYAGEQLEAAGETAEMRERHLDFYLALAERAEPELERDQDTWRRVLETDHDNIRTALRWGLAADDPERGRRLVAAMARLWFLHGHAHEGLVFLTKAIELAPEDRSPVQARLHAGLAMLGMISGRIDLVVETASRGIDLAADGVDERAHARCVVMAGYHPFFFDFERCEVLAREAHALGASAGDPFARDWGLVLAAYSLTTRDLHDDAVALARQAYELSLPRGDRFTAAFALGVELYAHMFRGELVRAVAAGDTMLEIIRPLGDYFGTGTNTANVAMAYGLSGDLDGARNLMAPIVRSIDVAPDVDVVGFMVTLGLVDLWAGELESAVRWFERGTGFLAPQLDNWTATRSYPGLVGALRRLGRLDEAHTLAERAIELARRFGAPYPLSEALDEQARLAADTDLARAADLHQEALSIRTAHGMRTFYVDSLEALAGIATRLGSHAEAARLVAASEQARTAMIRPRNPVDRADHAALLETLEAELGADAFQAATAEGAAMSLDEAMSYATRSRGPRDRPATGWASLTPTELEVVRLVVDGLTNPQIGARLFIGRATVKTHLSHVYGKLGVANRTELATLAGRHLTDRTS